jgi:hypothetical protein
LLAQSRKAGAAPQRAVSVRTLDRGVKSRDVV